MRTAEEIATALERECAGESVNAVSFALGIFIGRQCLNQGRYGRYLISFMDRLAKIAEVEQARMQLEEERKNR